MKALVCNTVTDDFSGLSVQDVPVPVVGEGEVLVRVKAASVNFPDLLMSHGMRRNRRNRWRGRLRVFTG